MMKKNLLSLGLAFALFLGTITTSTAEEVYKIGAILPLTGNLAFLGEPGKNALTMGQEELRRKGINIDIKFYDSKADPKEGISAFYKAIDIDKVKFVLTTLTGVSLAVKPIANKKKIFQGIIAIYPAITKGSNYAMRFCYNAELEAKVILDYVEQKNMRKLFIMRSLDPVAEIEVRDYIRPSLESAGIKVEEETFNVGQKDFKAQVLKLRNSGIKTVILLGYGSDFPGILREMKNQMIFDDIQIIGGIGYIELPEHIEYELVKNAVFTVPSFYVSSIGGKIGKEFKERYKLKFNKDVTYDAAYTYDGLKILAEAFENVQNIEPKDIRDYILRKKTFQGVGGVLNFTPDGDVESSISLARYTKNMTWEKVVK